MTELPKDWSKDGVPNWGAAPAHGFVRETARKTRQSLGLHTVILPLGDLAAILATAFLSVFAVDFLYEGLLGLDYGADAPDRIQHRLVELAVISLFGVILFSINGDYRRRIPFWQEIKHIIAICFFLMLVDGFGQFAFNRTISRAWILVGWTLTPVALIGMRAIVRGQLRRMGFWTVPTVLVGSDGALGSARSIIENAPELGYQIVSALPLNKRGGIGKLAAELGRLSPGLVIIAPGPQETEHAGRLIDECSRRDIPFAIAPSLGAIPVHGMEIEYYFSHDFALLLPKQNLQRPAARALKRFFDIVVAWTMVLFLTPLFVAFSVLIKLDGGPVVFGHERVGRNGKPFECLKFRTMVADADARLARHLDRDPDARAEWEASFKLKHDPRITWIGRFLRKTSLDELPQLLNVIRGEMSLVGPRPVIREELERYYGGEAAHYTKALPGITGLWQVSGRNDTTYAERVRLDAWYAKNWSLWGDIVILLRTVPAVLRNSGAY
ncbi:MAG: undecaprenyl-phosphate galactose phosphotransferase WbaP [Euryhalocaulis sp.]|uniref:undecaprenyl-phosphate galactose phosphotransferase WbaP n=1 Tax=Euryhalocaulis sp. TaxID=2744307 RepID=UPI0017E27B13|nr:undecaprenyl-phosphate galactose phosphotransferase WbaP [Euryhalocaulis sp.]MBA4802336.1 undecaprenyl-phosphate galactose phosphotransferase WbaP [Euryhalocaulis sp.]